MGDALVFQVCLHQRPLALQTDVNFLSDRRHNVRFDLVGSCCWVEDPCIHCTTLRAFVDLAGLTVSESVEFAFPLEAAGAEIFNASLFGGAVGIGDVDQRVLVETQLTLEFKV